MLTAETYRKALQDAVDLKGADYVYVKPDGATTCRYLEENQPSCIHGHALHSLGYTDLSGYEGVSVRLILTDLGVTDEALIEAATRSQFVQDNGQTWGTALEVFDSQLSNPIPAYRW